jgi:hypothetical protein
MKSGMVDVRVYFAILVQTFAIIVGIVAQTLQMNYIGRRFTSLESKLTSLEASMNARFAAIENRFTIFEARVGAILDRH